MNGVQTRFKCKLDVKRCKRFVFPPSSLLPRSNALKTKAIRYFQTDRTLTRIVSPPLYYQGAHCGSFLFREAIKYIKKVHPGPCLMELNVNRNNKALQFYEHMGMRKLREGDFPIGNGYYMNDYIMGLEI